MKSPFQYGGVVRGDSFCNRREEVEDLLRAMGNGEKLFVYSESSYTSSIKSINFWVSCFRDQNNRCLSPEEAINL